MSTILLAMFVLFSLKLLRDSLFYAWLWQIKEYRIDRMTSHLKGIRLSDKGGWGVITAVILLILYFVFLKNHPLLFQYLVLTYFALAVFQIIAEVKNRTLKKPKPTLKIIFIFFLLAIVYSLIAFCYISFLFAKEVELPIGSSTSKSLISGSMLALFLSFINPLIISSIIISVEPLFYFQKKRIIKRAAEKMRRLKKVKVIGITGSYGKTSTKEFLYTILSQKYKVVKTEGNNNTNIGVAYTVLDKVSDEYDYFICEMGAYKRGEIKEMCDIVMPEIGILTGIGNQHIDLFGSRDNIVKAKFELIEALPEDGLAMISSKFKACPQEALGVQSSKLQFKVKNFQYFSLDDVKNTRVHQDYVEFEFVTTPNSSLNKEGGIKSHPELVSGSVGDLGLANFISPKSTSNYTREYSGSRRKMLKQVQHDNNRDLVKFRVNLLGKHYIENLLSAIITARYLEMSLEEIRNAVEKIEPTEYMMRKLEGPNDAVFIDDSYSANFDGVVAALNYLEEAYSDYKKIIVFPGIIELGKESEEVHRKLFKRIGEVCGAAYILEIGNWKLGNWGIEKYPLDKGGRGVKCRFIFEKDFGKAAEMLKKDLMLPLISNPPTPLIRGAKIVVLFESRGAGAVMRKFKMEKIKR